MFEYIPSQIGKCGQTTRKIHEFIITAGIECSCNPPVIEREASCIKSVRVSWIDAIVCSVLWWSVQECVSEVFRCYSHGDVQVRSSNTHPSAIFLLRRNIPGTDTQTHSDMHTQRCSIKKAHLTPRNTPLKSCCKSCMNTCCQLGERRDRMRKITTGRQQKKAWR